MAAGNIDSLTIEIEASSEKAARQIDNLARALRNLKSVADQRISFTNIKGALRAIDASDMAKIRGLASALRELKSVGSMSIGRRLGPSLQEISTAIQSINSSTFSKLRQLAAALKTFEGVKAFNVNAKLADNILNLAAAFSEINENTLRRISFLGNALKSLEGASKINISGTLGGRLADLVAALDLMTDDHVRKLGTLAQAFVGMKGAKTSIGDKLPIQLLNLAGAVDQITDETIERIYRLCAALSQLRGIDLRGVGSAMAEQRRAIKDAEKQANAKESGTTEASAEKVKGKLEGISGVLEKIVNLAKSFSSVLKSIALGVLSAIWNAFKKIVSAIGNAVKAIGKFALNMAKLTPKLLGIDAAINAFKKLKNVIESFKRIAFYRLIRSAIRMVTDTLKEGSENAYWYSKQFGNATKYISERLDAMSSASYKMGNQMGAAFDTLLVAIQPVLMQVIAWITKAMEAVTQFFAVLSGKSTYLKAKDYTKEWVDETNKGNKAAKEWKNQLLGFDEINRLEEPSSGGSGSGNDNLDYGSMFEEVPINSWFQDMMDALKSDKWAKMGKMIGQRFNELVDGFDWEGWGKKIGKSIQNAIYFVRNFLKTADFREVGAGIVEFFDNAFGYVNFNTLASIVVQLRTSIWDVIVGAVARLGQNGAARHLAFSISDYITGAFQELAAWIKTIPSDDIANAIKEFFGNIQYEEIKNAFVTLTSTAWNKAIELKDAIFDEKTKEKITEYLREFFEKLNWEDIREGLKNGWATLMEKLDQVWPKADREAFATQVADDLKAVLEQVLGPMLEEIGTWAWDKLKGAFKKAIISGITINGFESMLGLFFSKADNGESEKAGAAVSQGFNSGFVTDWDTASPETLKQFQAFIDDTNAIFNIHSPSKVFEGIGENVSKGFIEGFETKWNEFTTNMQTMWDSFISWWSGLSLPQMDIKMPHIRVDWEDAGDIAQFFGFNSVPSLHVDWYANGGFPEDGLFMANHGELVGKFANGKNAVANNEQIVEGIRQGVYEAVSAAMSNSGGNNGGGQVAVLNINGREFARAIWSDQRAVSNEHGGSLIIGA